MNSSAILRLIKALGLMVAVVRLMSVVGTAQSGLDQPEPFGVFFNGVFPADSPGSTPGGSWATTNAFPALTFPEPVRIVEHPRADQLVVVSKTGPIWIFANSSQILSDPDSLTDPRPAAWPASFSQGQLETLEITDANGNTSPRVWNYPFSDSNQSGQNQIRLAPGETLVTGYMDSFPDGSGWGAGSVISATTTGGAAEDDVWAILPEPLMLESTPFNPSVDTPTIVLGQSIETTNAGKALHVYPDFQRSSQLSISYALGSNEDGGGTPGIITNGSFEAGFDAWTISGNLSVEFTTPYQATQGFKLAAFNSRNLTPNGVLSQSFATTPGLTYTLAFDAGVLSYNLNPQSLLVTVTGNGNLLSQSITIHGLGGGTNHWLPQSFSFTANSATATLTFQDQSAFTNSLDLLLDNVRVSVESGAANTAPVAVADSYAAIQNSPLVVAAPGVLANDSDAQADPLTAVLDAGPGHGSLTLNASGGFTYTPAPGYTGADSFTYHANDGNLDSNVVTVSITVNAGVAAALVNGSFEADFTGWTHTGNQTIQSGAPYVPTDGSKLVAFNSGNLTPNGVLSQSFATTPGQSYTLAFDAGVLAYNTLPQSLLVTVTGNGSLLSQSITVTGLGGGATRWVPQSFSFTANSATSTLTFHDQSAFTNSLDLVLDNVRVSGGPPPGTSFATIPGKSFIARFRIVPGSGEVTVPRLHLKISGNSTLKELDLLTALPAGANAVPYFLLFTADSATTTLHFTGLNGDPIVASQIADLEVAQPLTLAANTLPNPGQQTLIDRQYGLFLHFGINTFNGQEWSDGSLPVSSYQPTDLDVEQWVQTACEAGMRYVLIIAKHHEGFCLWDSPWTTYDVAASPVKTDVIAAAAAACRKLGIDMGIYYSLWDRHEPSYANDADYNQFAMRQLAELLENYGPVCELWLDGAWDKANTRWPSTEIYDLARRLQPGCQVSINGTIGHPNHLDYGVLPGDQQQGYPIRYFPSDFRLSDRFLPKVADPKLFSHSGASYYLPFETNITLSSSGNWFYQPSDNLNRPLSELAAIYQSATAEDNILVLNAPPDRSGRVRDLERNTLFALREQLGLASRCSLPYGGTPWAVPGRIQAEDFDCGGQGVSYNDLTPTNEGGQYRSTEGVDIAITTDEGGGHQVWATAAGEWLKYTVTVASSGKYHLELRCANPGAGGQAYLEVDGVDVSGLIAIPQTGSLDLWQSVTVPDIHLSVGHHVLRLVMAAESPGGIAGAFNWFALTRPGPTAIAGPDLQATDEDDIGSVELTLDASASVAGITPITSFAWFEGGTLLASGINPAVSLVVGSHVIELRVTDEGGLQDTDEVVVTVSARSIGLVNGSFESGFTGWTATGNQSIPSGAPYVPTDGSKVVAFNSANRTPNGVLSQSFATAPGQSYTLAFDAGVLAYNLNPQTLLVTVTGSGGLLSQSITINGLGGGATRWVPQSFTFTANSATSTLTFKDQSVFTNSLDLVLDNVRITGPPPGPNTAPVAVADSYATLQNSPLVVAAPGVLSNDSDAQANPLTAVLDVGPGHGSLTLNASGGFTYTPAAGFSGADSFSYHANDGSLNSNVVTVSITVSAGVAAVLVNGSFEAGFDGWTATGNQSIQSGAPYVPSDGGKLVAFNSANRTPNGVLSQSFATAPGQSYTLAFDAGVLAYNTLPQTVLVTVTGNGSLLSQSVTVTGLGGGATRWVPQSFTFTANSATSTLTFHDQSAFTNSLDLVLDHVRVSGPAPSAPQTAPATAAPSAPATLSGPPRISRMPDGVRIDLNVAQPGRYELQRSSDLKTWESVEHTTLATPGLLEFTAPRDAEMPRLFYRIARQPGEAPGSSTGD